MKQLQLSATSHMNKQVEIMKLREADASLWSICNSVLVASFLFILYKVAKVNAGIRCEINTSMLVKQFFQYLSFSLY